MHEYTTDCERINYRRNLVLILIVAIFIIPALGGYGFATFTAGPDWLRLFWFVPGWIVWAGAALGAIWLRRNRERWAAPIVDELGALTDAAQPYLDDAPAYTRETVRLR